MNREQSGRRPESGRHSTFPGSRRRWMVTGALGVGGVLALVMTLGLIGACLFLLMWAVGERSFALVVVFVSGLVVTGIIGAPLVSYAFARPRVSWAAGSVTLEGGFLRSTNAAFLTVAVIDVSYQEWPNVPSSQLLWLSPWPIRPNVSIRWDHDVEVQVRRMLVPGLGSYVGGPRQGPVRRPTGVALRLAPRQARALVRKGSTEGWT